MPSSRSGRAFAVIALVDSTGTGFYLAGSAIFFVRVAGLTHAQLGVGLAVWGVTGLIATVPLGVLTDRFGARRMLIAFQLWRATWFAVLAFTHGPVAFVVVAACLGLTERAVSPATQAVVAAAVPDLDRTRAMATVRSVRNIGFSLGAALTAPLVASDSTALYRVVILANAVSFVCTAALLLNLRVHTPPSRIARGGMAIIRGFRDWRYLCLTGLNSALTTHMTLLAVALPLWTINNTDAPAAIVPLLVVMNTILTVVFQVPFSRDVDDAEGGTRAMRRAGMCQFGCCLALAAAAANFGVAYAVGVLVVATALMTGGELWQSAGGWTLSFRYAPEDRKAEYLSIFALSPALQNIVGPVAITVLVLNHGSIGWVALSLTLAVVTLLIRPCVAALERQVTPVTAPVS